MAPGKSTVLKAIVGGIQVQRGEILFRGESVAGLPSHQIVRRGLAYVPQRDNIFPRLTVQENLELGGNPLSGADRRDVFERIFELFPHLGTRRRRRAGSLSGGERQMVAIARALMANPCLLLLDEPSAGLAPSLVETLFEHIQDIQREGITVLLVEQNARRALAISDRGYALDLGQTRFEGAGPALLQDQKSRQSLPRWSCGRWVDCGLAQEGELTPRMDWPNGYSAAVSLTFDVDAESAWLSLDPDNAHRPGVLSQGWYGPRVGLPLILDLLRRHGLKATFFVPGVIAEAYESRIREILGEGHELGLHGYTHTAPRSKRRSKNEQNWAALARHSRRSVHTAPGIELPTVT